MMNLTDIQLNIPDNVKTVKVKTNVGLILFREPLAIELIKLSQSGNFKDRIEQDQFGFILELADMLTLSIDGKPHDPSQLAVLDFDSLGKLTKEIMKFFLTLSGDQT